MKKNTADHLEAYHFEVGEVVTVGGNPNVLGEVTDVSNSVQLAVRIMTPPLQGKTIYTTRFTYYTTPMPHLTVEKVRAMYETSKKREIGLTGSSNGPLEKEEDLNESVSEETNNVILDNGEITKTEEVDVAEPLAKEDIPTELVEEEVVATEPLVEEVITAEFVEEEAAFTEPLVREAIVTESVEEDDFTQLSLF